MEIYLSLVMLAVVLVFPNFRKAFFSVPAQGAEGVSAPMKRRLVWVDAVRGIAIMAVIIIHVTYMFRLDIRGTDVVINDILNNLFRFAVPVFFITAGMLQPSVPLQWRAIGAYYRHRLVTLIVPYTLICLVIILFRDLSLREAFFGWMRGDISPPYWFVIVLFQFYLIYPFIQWCMKWRYATIFSFMFSYICYLLWWNWIGGVPIFPRFLFFFVWGMSMRRILLSSRIVVPSLRPWMGIVFIYLIMMFSLPVRQYNARYFYGMAMFVILAFLCRRWQKSTWVHGLASVGRRSLWIYLTHFFVVRYIYDQLFVLGLSYDLAVVYMVLFALPSSLIVAVMVDRIYRYCLDRK